MRAILEHNLTQTLQAIAAARGAAAAPGACRLLAVTKSVQPAVALELYALGQRDFAENRLQVLEEKLLAFSAAGIPDARWHFIGHLQRNKARRVVRLCQAIHSLDSEALIETLQRVAAEEDRRPEVFVELHLSGEDSKQGLPIEDLDRALDCLFDCPNLRPRGLMTMAPLVAEPEAARAAARETFERLAEIANAQRHRPWAQGRAELSMGMSGDWREAIQAGSDWLRIGSALFVGLPAPLRAEGGAA